MKFRASRFLFCRRLAAFLALFVWTAALVAPVAGDDESTEPKKPAVKPLIRLRVLPAAPKAVAKPALVVEEEEAPLAIPKVGDAKSKLPPENATHEQITKIKVGGGEGPCTLNTFCLSADGKIIAAVNCSSSSVRAAKSTDNAGPIGQLRWFDGDGKALDSWSLDVAPTAVNIGADGAVYVAGGGKVLKLDSTGKVLLTADSPNKKDFEENADKIKAELAPLFASPKERMKKSLETMKARVEELEAKEAELKAEEKELSRTDKVRLTSARRTVESLEKTIENLVDQKPQDVEEQIKRYAESKKRISGIAVTDKDVFVACSAALGYGYDVWRLDLDLQNPVKIVEKLRGCCGQMDIQARGNDLCVAENSMHRVCRYDREGKLVKAFGEREAISQRGFEGCCNPMNLRIATNGEIYTSESSIGRIRRFSPDGEYLGLVGKASLISGCKHVAIGVTTDTKRVYLLDVTKGEIVILQQKDGEAKTTAAK